MSASGRHTGGGAASAPAGTRARGKLACLLRVQALGLFGINRALHGGNRRDRVRLAALAAGAAALVALFAF